MRDVAHTDPIDAQAWWPPSNVLRPCHCTLYRAAVTVQVYGVSLALCSGCLDRLRAVLKRVHKDYHGSRVDAMRASGERGDVTP